MRSKCARREWVIKIRDTGGVESNKRCGGCLRSARPVGQLSARAEQNDASGQRGAAVCTSAISRSKVNSRANKQTGIKRENWRETHFLWVREQHIHYIYIYTQQRGIGVSNKLAHWSGGGWNWCRYACVHYRLSAANIRRADGFCVFYIHFLRLCVRVLRAGRNPILLSSHIWFINMHADKFIAEPECCACAPIHHLVAPHHQYI